MTVDGPRALRGSSVHVGDIAGDAFHPTAQRGGAPSKAPSGRPIAGSESRRAISCPAPTAAGAWHAPSIARGCRAQTLGRGRKNKERPSFRKFLSRAPARSSPERARALRLAPLPRWVRCLRAWYISKLVCDGGSNKIVPQKWRGRHPSPPGATAMHAL